MTLQSIRIWDGPTRLFHWSLALLVLVAFLTGLQGGNWMVWHERTGLAILGLLSFRLVWGFVGSTYARFADFVPTPARILAYIQGRWHGLGHNPLGALSVFALLAVLVFQVLSGLFANDDIAFRGPLYDLVSKGVSNDLSGLHRQAIWLIGALVALHILAALFYTLVRRQNLIRPMVTGMKSVESAQAKPAQGGGLLALLVALLVAALVVWIGAGGLLPPPPPAAPPPAW
ncbi:cytochrome b/b6 domain-containing protein [Thiorhodovibrio frisius]|uniref:Cytochrome b n=1 Tax=Thiorhodovibrio frisius TaxID=631362 RepID=H8Z2Z8_9GAMM|nr:cytochrome b/b6 domain-containing protein [Thiorhodovibrio frisius]EIC22770.1 cytochrome b [Thiorhodovibrio frisius]WPL22529.1 putative Ni/Fe-hydrogenase 1 B-type cytochrome subunit [Thiorhodovibrio frisius]